MRSLKGVLLFFGSAVALSFSAAEYVPVYIWGPHSAGKPLPALHRLSRNSFEDELSTKFKTVPKIVVFAEESLSPEDFGHRDSDGNTAYPNLAELRKSSKVTYLSSVQNPLEAIEALAGNDVVNISVESLSDSSELPDSKVIIVALNDAVESEERTEMLKRHDDVIRKVYGELLGKYENILAFYTAKRQSWTPSEHIHSRRVRAVDPIVNDNIYINNETVMIYSGSVILTESGSDPQSFNLTYVAQNDSGIIYANATSTAPLGLSVSFLFIKSVTGYWYLQQTEITYNSTSISQTTNTTIFAPTGFSYACGNQTFSNTNLSVTFPDFQVEPVYKVTYLTQSQKFNDPYNCVGFTTIPIWSGLFVTFILILIMTFGLTMMMDIKTMDRFDDAKGKTITINTSE